MKLWKNAHRYNGTRPFGPWFLRIAMRAALDILKGVKSKPSIELDFDPRDPERDDLEEERELSPKTAWYRQDAKYRYQPTPSRIN